MWIEASRLYCRGKKVRLPGFAVRGWLELTRVGSWRQGEVRYRARLLQTPGEFSVELFPRLNVAIRYATENGVFWVEGEEAIPRGKRDVDRYIQEWECRETEPPPARPAPYDDGYEGYGDDSCSF